MLGAPICCDHGNINSYYGLNPKDDAFPLLSKPAVHPNDWCLNDALCGWLCQGQFSCPQISCPLHSLPSQPFSQTFLTLILLANSLIALLNSHTSIFVLAFIFLATLPFIPLCLFRWWSCALFWASDTCQDSALSVLAGHITSFCSHMGFHSQALQPLSLFIPFSSVHLGFLFLPLEIQIRPHLTYAIEAQPSKVKPYKGNTYSTQTKRLGLPISTSDFPYSIQPFVFACCPLFHKLSWKESWSI